MDRRQPTPSPTAARRRPWFASVASPWQNPARVLLLASLVAAVIAIMSMLDPSHIGGVDAGPLLNVAALGLIASVLVCRAMTGKPLGAWTFVALGGTTTAAATVLTLVDGTGARIALELLTLVARVLLGIGAVLLVDRRRRQRGDHRSRLDGIIIGLSVGALGAAIWFDSVVEAAADPRVALSALAVPLVDLIVVAVIGDALLSRHTRASTSSCLLFVGLLVITAADVSHLRAVVLSATRPGWAAAALVAGLALVALAAAAPTITADEDAPLRRAGAGAGVSAVPIVFSIVSLGVLAYGIAYDVDVVASLLALAAVGLVIVVRTTLTMRELHVAAESFALARTDELTGLMNRRGFLEALDRMLADTTATATADTTHRPLALAIIDLNGFKEINDSFGHLAGDDLLCMVAQRFRDVIPANALLARLGGDEFGLVTPVDGGSSGLAVAETVQRALDGAFEVEGATVRVGAAVGVALHPAHADTRSTLFRCADVAMYDAKRSHRGVSMYVPLTDFGSHDELQLLGDLRTVVDEQRLMLHYLPTVDLRTGCVVASEALVRWRHPTRGLLAPDTFIPLAERSGLMPGITRTVIAQAIAFHAERFPGLAVSVNISACDLADDRLGDYIDDVLEIYRFDASHLTLEIRESALVQDPMRAAGALASIRARGIRLSIDDFGLDQFSSARLFEVPVDEVKIDQSLVRAMEHDEGALAIVTSTVQRASALDLVTVAEGIESERLLTAVTRAGILRGQGFLLGRPIPADEYADYLARVQPPSGRQPF
jgi:diguanylate cyclase (GGDEF)-like protein